MNIKIEQRSFAVSVSNASQVSAVSPTFGAAGLAFSVSAALAFLTSVAATIYLCHSMPPAGGMPMPGGWTMSMAWMKMPGQSWLGSGASFIAMWIVMMVAMMLPSFVPMLVSYRRSMNCWGIAKCNSLTMLVAAGYFTIWTMIGLAVYPLGVVMANSAMRWAFLARSVPIVTGVVLMVAGCLQLTAWKVSQLELCRSAPACNQAVSQGTWRAGQHGVYLGAQCILCCFNLMLVVLVSGVMDLGVMAAVAIAITAERTTPFPRRAACVAGAAIFALGVFKVAEAC